jgi:hypothetical protein
MRSYWLRIAMKDKGTTSAFHWHHWQVTDSPINPAGDVLFAISCLAGFIRHVGTRPTFANGRD